MMGLPDGWVTDTPGVKRNDALKMCGNGAVSYTHLTLPTKA